MHMTSGRKAVLFFSLVMWVYYGITLGMKAGAWGYFAPEISRSVGLSTTEIGVVAGILLAGSSLFMPIAGLFIGRYGTRISMYIGLCVGVFGLLSMSVGTQSYHFYLAAVLLAFSTSFGGLVPITTLIVNWFDRYRSRAMAAIFTASPIWGAFSYVIYELLLQFVTWREALAMLTIIMPVGLLLVWAFIPNRPGDIGIEVDGGLPAEREQASGVKAHGLAAGADAREWTVRSALLSSPFWLITLSTSAAMMPYLFFQTFGRMMLESSNVAAGVAVSALMSLTLASLLGRLIAAAADFVDPRLIILACLAGNVLGIALLLTSQSALLIYVGAFLLGVSFGVSLLIAPLLLSRYFGGTVFPTVQAIKSATVIGINAALTPIYGLMIDYYDDYQLPFGAVAALNLLMITFVAAPWLGRTYVRRQARRNAA